MVAFHSLDGGFSVVLLCLLIVAFANDLSDCERLWWRKRETFRIQPAHAYAYEMSAFCVSTLPEWGHCRWLPWPDWSLCRPISAHAPSSRSLLSQWTAETNREKTLNHLIMRVWYFEWNQIDLSTLFQVQTLLECVCFCVIYTSDLQIFRGKYVLQIKHLKVVQISSILTSL